MDGRLRLHRLFLLIYHIHLLRIGNCSVFTENDIHLCTYEIQEDTFRNNDQFGADATFEDGNCHTPVKSGARTSCTDDDDCIDSFDNYEIAEGFNASFVHPPFCQKENLLPSFLLSGESNNGSMHRSREEDTVSNGYCTCGKYCKSYSRTSENIIFYYCGPCGRIGSDCSYSNDYNYTCHLPSICRGSFCECDNKGVFYELFYCIVPYYGYQLALQMAIGTCILIAVFLLLGSVATAMGIRFRRLQQLRQLLRRESYTQSPLNDNPPKYEDVVEVLPSYDDAMELQHVQEDGSTQIEVGIENGGFETDTQMTEDISSLQVIKETNQTDLNQEALIRSNSIEKTHECRVSKMSNDGSNLVEHLDEVDDVLQNEEGNTVCTKTESNDNNAEDRSSRPISCIKCRNIEDHFLNTVQDVSKIDKSNSSCNIYTDIQPEIENNASCTTNICNHQMQMRDPISSIVSVEVHIPDILQDLPPPQTN